MTRRNDRITGRACHAFDDGIIADLFRGGGSLFLFARIRFPVLFFCLVLSAASCNLAVSIRRRFHCRPPGCIW